MTEGSFQSLINGISFHDDSGLFNIALRDPSDFRSFDINVSDRDGAVSGKPSVNVVSQKMLSGDPANGMTVSSGCGTVTMAAVPISALAPGKISFPLGDLENIPIFNTGDGASLELQALQGNTQALQGIQTVKLTLINCGDQQTILLTTPSTHFTMPEQSLDGVTLTLPDNLLATDLNLAGLSSVQLGDLQLLNDKCNAADCAKISNYVNMTSLPPISSVSDKLYNQITGEPEPVQPSHSYAIEDLKPVPHRAGEKMHQSEGGYSVNDAVSVALTSSPDTPLPRTTFSQSVTAKPTKLIDQVNVSPVNQQDSIDQDGNDQSCTDDLGELNTKDLAQRISAELKRYTIPQAVFAQRVLCRSQGTLSDLLRNPKPWSKLKSGRETFRRMWNWLNEPEYQRMSALRLATCKRKTEETQKMADERSSKKPRLVFTDIQRRTLHAIFKETKRPSKEMQSTIAQQLNLEVSTVANFFMNARRRSLDKWVDDKDVQHTASTSSPVHSLEASPANHTTHVSSQMQDHCSMRSVHDNLPTSQLSDVSNPVLHRITSCHNVVPTLELPPSPAPPRLTPDPSISFDHSDVHLNAPCLVNENEQNSLSGGLLLSSADSAALQTQLLGHVLVGGQNAMLLSHGLSPASEKSVVQSLSGPGLSCMASNLTNIKSALDSLCDPPRLSPSHPHHVSMTSLEALHEARSLQHQHSITVGSVSDPCTTNHVLPSASTLIGHDRITVDGVGHISGSAVLSSSHGLGASITMHPKQEDLGSGLLGGTNTSLN
ncbi:One cut domain family member [Paragonimus heterotremus]|uniref:One cut domain family member n=1 Tax=Paragonimus heterotremus TaxID=100268 RepID=A0A8J4SNT8_9TREM|nr:One cut domain family member [Paragonimus heterotremus]